MDIKTIDSLLNNRLAPKVRQQVSNINEFLYSEIAKWFIYVQMCGPELWMLYAYILEIKHDMLCLDYIWKNIDKYSSFPNWYFDSLSTLFSKIMGLNDELKDAKTYGYEKIILKPHIPDKNLLKKRVDQGIIKPPTWQTKHQRILLNYVLNDLKILHSDVKLTDQHVDHCFNLLKCQFTKEFIRDKLAMKFFCGDKLIIIINFLYLSIFFLCITNTTAYVSVYI